MDWVEFTGKTVDEALDLALDKMEVSSDQVEYEVLEKETSGLLGLFSKPAKIRVRLLSEEELTEDTKNEEEAAPVMETETVVETETKESGLNEEVVVDIPVEKLCDTAEDFLDKVCSNMGIEATFEVSCEREESLINVNIVGQDMGLLIGKRGQTLDALQYLTSLVVNKESGTYFKVKIDTENYRARRKETLENLARNIASKVKKTRKPVALEPMNPYERRIIHSALQNDKMVETYSEGEEPNRKIIIAMKKNFRDSGNRNGGYRKYNNRNYKKNYGGYDKRGFERKEGEEQPVNTVEHSEE